MLRLPDQLHYPLILGIVVFNMTATLGWMGCQQAIVGRAGATTTERLSSLSKQLHAYQEASGRFPVALQDLRFLDRFDGWGHAIVYVHHGTRFTLRSLGADGKEGGEGIDQDVGHDGDHSYQKSGTATLWQFLFSPSLVGERTSFFLICFVHGLLWGAIVHAAEKHKPTKAWEQLMLAGILTGLFLLTSLFSLFWITTQLVGWAL